MGKKGKGGSSGRAKITASTVRTFTGHGTLDKFLASKQLARKTIAGDGSCLFRAVAEQVLLSQCHHQKVRLQCADYIKSHWDDFKEFVTVSMESYISHLTEKEMWGGEVELVALSRMFRRTITVYNEQQNGAVQEQLFQGHSYNERSSPTNERKTTSNDILLAYSDGNHYDSVYTTEHMENLAFCQGMVYRLLYTSVLNVKIPPVGMHRLNELRKPDLHTTLGGRGETQASRKAMQNLLKYYNEDAILAMASNTYLNVALDIHQREKDSIERHDHSMAASIQFQVGDRCVFRLEEGGADTDGEITTLNSQPGLHSVYVYQHKETWEIPSKNIVLSVPKHTTVPTTGRRNPSTANSAHSRPQTTPTSQSNPYVGNKQSAAKDLTPNSAPTPHKPHTLTRPPSTPSQQPARAREKEAPSSSSSSSSTKRDDKDDPIKKGPPHHHLPDAKPKHHAEIVPTGSKAVPAGSSKVIKQSIPEERSVANSTAPSSTTVPKKADQQQQARGRGVSQRTPTPIQLPPSVPAGNNPPLAPAVAATVPNSSNGIKSAPKGSYPVGAKLSKSGGGPHGSLTSDDSCNYTSSSSDESSNGNGGQQHHATASGRSNVTVAFPHGLPPPLIPATASNPMGGVQDVRHGQLEGLGKGKITNAVLSSNKKSSPIEQHDSPYLEPKIPRDVSSQPEDAWPVIAPESVKESQRPLPNITSAAAASTTTAAATAAAVFALPSQAYPHLPPSMIPFFTGPGSPPTCLPFTTAMPPPYISHPGILAHHPIPQMPIPISSATLPHVFAAPIIKPPITSSSVQTDVKVFKTVDVQTEQPRRSSIGVGTGAVATAEVAVQCAPPEVTSNYTQTEEKVVPVAALRPPVLRDEDKGSSLELMFSYSLQCAKLYTEASGEMAFSTTLAAWEELEQGGLRKILEDLAAAGESKLDSDQQSFIKSLRGKADAVNSASTREQRQGAFPFNGSGVSVKGSRSERLHDQESLNRKSIATPTNAALQPRPVDMPPSSESGTKQRKRYSKRKQQQQQQQPETHSPSSTSEEDDQRSEEGDSEPEKIASEPGLPPSEHTAAAAAAMAPFPPQMHPSMVMAAQGLHHHPPPPPPPPHGNQYMVMPPHPMWYHPIYPPMYMPPYPHHPHPSQMMHPPPPPLHPMAHMVPPTITAMEEDGEEEEEDDIKSENSSEDMGKEATDLVTNVQAESTPPPPPPPLVAVEVVDDAPPNSTALSSSPVQADVQERSPVSVSVVSSSQSQQKQQQPECDTKVDAARNTNRDTTSKLSISTGPFNSVAPSPPSPSCRTSEPIPEGNHGSIAPAQPQKQQQQQQLPDRNGGNAGKEEVKPSPLVDGSSDGAESGRVVKQQPPGLPCRATNEQPAPSQQQQQQQEVKSSKNKGKKKYSQHHDAVSTGVAAKHTHQQSSESTASKAEKTSSRGSKSQAAVKRPPPHQKSRYSKNPSGSTTSSSAVVGGSKMARTTTSTTEQQKKALKESTPSQPQQHQQQRDSSSSQTHTEHSRSNPKERNRRRTANQGGGGGGAGGVASGSQASSSKSSQDPTRSASDRIGSRSEPIALPTSPNSAKVTTSSNSPRMFHDSFLPSASTEVALQESNYSVSATPHTPSQDNTTSIVQESDLLTAHTQSPHEHLSNVQESSSQLSTPYDHEARNEQHKSLTPHTQQQNDRTSTAPKRALFSWDFSSDDSKRIYCPPSPSLYEMSDLESVQEQPRSSLSEMERFPAFTQLTLVPQLNTAHNPEIVNYFGDCMGDTSFPPTAAQCTTDSVGAYGRNARIQPDSCPVAGSVAKVDIRSSKGGGSSQAFDWPDFN